MLGLLSYDRLVRFFLFASVVHVLYYFISVGNWWVHAHYFADIMPQSFANGAEISIKDFFDAFQMRAPNEQRARFLNYLLMAFDHKIRYMVLQYFFLPPQVSPIITLSVFVVAPVSLFFGTLRYCGSKNAALLTTSIFLLSIGYMSQAAVLFMAAKPVSLAIVTICFWLAAELFHKSSNASSTFVKCIGWQKWALLVLLFMGFFVDETSLYGFALVFILFPERFISGYETMLNRIWSRIGFGKLDSQFINASSNSLISGPNLKHFYITFANVSLFLAPFLAILVVLATVVPMITMYHHDWNFDYFNFNFNLRNDINFGGEYPKDTKVDANFIVWNTVLNFIKIFELSFFPWFVMTFFGVSTGTGLYTLGVLPKSLLFASVVLPIFFVVYSLVTANPQSSSAAANPQSSSAQLIKRTYVVHSFLALLIFVVFITILQIKHVPTISGYNYGAMYCLPLALVFGLTIDRAKNCSCMQNIFTVLILSFFAISNVTNFGLLHKNWDIFHRQWNYSHAYFPSPTSLGASTYNKVPNSLQFNVFPTMERSSSYSELLGIYRAWRSKQLDVYLSNITPSTSSMSLIYELRLGDAAKEKTSFERKCWLLLTPTTCSKHWR